MKIVVFDTPPFTAATESQTLGDQALLVLVFVWAGRQNLGCFGTVMISIIVDTGEAQERHDEDGTGGSYRHNQQRGWLVETRRAISFSFSFHLCRARL